MILQYSYSDENDKIKALKKTKKKSKNVFITVHIKSYRENVHVGNHRLYANNPHYYQVKTLRKTEWNQTFQVVSNRMIRLFLYKWEITETFLQYSQLVHKNVA